MLLVSKAAGIYYITKAYSVEEAGLRCICIIVLTWLECTHPTPELQRYRDPPLRPPRPCCYIPTPLLQLRKPSGCHEPAAVYPLPPLIKTTIRRTPWCHEPAGVLPLIKLATFCAHNRFPLLTRASFRAHCRGTYTRAFCSDRSLCRELHNKR